MTQQLRVVYKDSDKSIIGFLGADLNAEEHEAISSEGIKVSSEVLSFDDDEIVMPEMAQVSAEGIASKV